jgi:hypothetical protein
MTRWRASCEGMISVNSIFASFAGTLAAVVVAFTTHAWVFEICVALFLIALVLFARAGETITDCIERNDVLLYQRAHQQYNVGVVLLLGGLAILLFALGYYVAAVIPLAATWKPWLDDAIWLIRRPTDEWTEYLDRIQQPDE